MMIEPHPARIWPEYLKFRFSLYIVKDDWPPTPASIWPEFLKFRFSLYMSQRWLTPLARIWPPGQDLTRIFKV